MATSTPTPDRATRPGLSEAVLVLIGAQAVSLLWVVLVIGLTQPDGLPDPIPAPLQVLLNLGLWAGYGLGPVLAVRSAGRPVGAVLGAEVRPLDVPSGVVLGVLLQLVVLPLLYLPILRVVDGDPGADARALMDAVDGPVAAVLFTVAVVVVAPLVEELFFRGLLLGVLRRRLGTPFAVVVSALVFALVHRQLLPLPGLFVFGVVAALAVVRTGRLGPAWAIHAGFNAATVVLLGLGAT